MKRFLLTLITPFLLVSQLSADIAKRPLTELIGEQQDLSFQEKIDFLLYELDDDEIDKDDEFEDNSFYLNENKEFVLVIKKRDENIYAIEFQDPKSHEGGIYSTFFPSSDENRYIGYLAGLRAIEGHSGNQLLAGMETFGQLMKPQFVFLQDGATATDKEELNGAYHQSFLRLHRVFTHSIPKGWYESKGYRPASAQELQKWYKIQESLEGYLWVVDEEDFENPELSELYEEAKEIIRSFTVRDLAETVPLLLEIEKPHTEELAMQILKLSSYGPDRLLWEVLQEISVENRSLFYEMYDLVIGIKGFPLYEVARYTLSHTDDENQERQFLLAMILLQPFCNLDSEETIDKVRTLATQRLLGESLDTDLMDELNDCDLAEGERKELMEYMESNDPDSPEYLGEVKFNLAHSPIPAEVTLDHLFSAIDYLKEQPATLIAKFLEEDIVDGSLPTIEPEVSLKDYFVSLTPEQRELAIESFTSEDDLPLDLLNPLLKREETSSLPGSDKFIQLQIAKIFIFAQEHFVHEF